MLAEYASRKSVQVASVSRSEKIRTYNFAQDRVTDHRLGLDEHEVRAFMRGDARRLLSLAERLHAHSQRLFLQQLIKALSL